MRDAGEDTFLVPPNSINCKFDHKRHVEAIFTSRHLYPLLAKEKNVSPQPFCSLNISASPLTSSFVPVDYAMLSTSSQTQPRTQILRARGFYQPSLSPCNLASGAYISAHQIPAKRYLRLTKGDGPTSGGNS